MAISEKREEIRNQLQNIMACSIGRPEVTNLKQMMGLKSKKESVREDWPENWLQLRCYVQCMRDAFTELDKYPRR